MAKRKPRWTPFYCSGCMAMPHYAGSKGYELCDRSFAKGIKHVIVEIPHYFFKDTLKFVLTRAGHRSGSWSFWRSVSSGILYPITLGEMDEVIKLTENGGEVTAVWQIKKKGANFSLGLAKKEDLQQSGGSIFDV